MRRTSGPRPSHVSVVRRLTMPILFFFYLIWLFSFLVWLFVYLC
jgi:hypothetical protein